MTHILVRSECRENEKRVGLLTLKVTKRDNLSIPEESLKIQINNELTKNLRLSQNMNLQKSINKKLIKPLQIEFVPEPPIGLKKLKLEQKFT